MARPEKPRFPTIAVDDTTTKKSIAFASDLEGDLNRYMAFYEAETGRKPRSFEDVVTGLLADRLAGDASFKKWKAANPAKK